MQGVWTTRLLDSGEPLKTRGTYNPPVLIERAPTGGVTLVMVLEDAHGGMADACYAFSERRESSDKWLWKLTRVVEWMPPTAPQLRRFDDSVRLPMMENGYFSTRLEAEQREREWAEYEAAQ